MYGTVVHKIDDTEAEMELPNMNTTTGLNELSIDTSNNNKMKFSQRWGAFTGRCDSEG